MLGEQSTESLLFLSYNKKSIKTDSGTDALQVGGDNTAPKRHMLMHCQMSWAETHTPSTKVVDQGKYFVRSNSASRDLFSLLGVFDDSEISFPRLFFAPCVALGLKMSSGKADRHKRKQVPASAIDMTAALHHC
jgi:hypothetical protein